MDEKILLYHYKYRLKDLNIKWIVQSLYDSDAAFGLIFNMNQTYNTAWQKCYEIYRQTNEVQKESMMGYFINSVEVCKSRCADILSIL